MTLKQRALRGCAGGLLTALLMASPASAFVQKVYVVDTGADSSTPVANDAKCSTREAIEDADAYAAGVSEPYPNCTGTPVPASDPAADAENTSNSIRFEVPLVAMDAISPQPFDVNSDIEMLASQKPERTTIDGGADQSVNPKDDPDDRGIFRVNGGARLVILNMTLQHGRTSGGGGAVLTQGSRTDAKGNVIKSRFEAAGSRFLENYGSGGGGALDLSGNALLMNDTFDANKGATGGHIAAKGGAVVISKSKLINGSASEKGGAVACDSGLDTSYLAINNSIVENNISAEYGFLGSDGGGGVWSGCNSTYLTGVQCDKNLAEGAGGGCLLIDSTAKRVKVELTSMRFNMAQDPGSQGGAIRSFYKGGGKISEFLISRSSITQNVALGMAGGGGIALDQTNNEHSKIANTTIFDNSAYQGDLSGAGASGAGVYVKDGDVDLTNVTIDGNHGASGLYFKPSSGGSDVFLKNTLIAHGGGLNCANLGGSFSDLGNNFQASPGGKSCGVAIPVGDPGLASLAWPDLGLPDGKRVQLTLRTPGPAIDNSGDYATCLAPPVGGVDEAGRPRVSADKTCSIGAAR